MSKLILRTIKTKEGMEKDNGTNNRTKGCH